MGDRANIVVEQDGGRIYLYSHWTGYQLPVVLRDALKRGERWDDDTYLTRIIFDQMTDGRHGETTGFGIGVYLSDNEYNILVVDPKAQTVIAEVEGGERLGSVGFDAYALFTDDEADAFRRTGKAPALI
jgi:hypothetical protein